MTTFRPTHHDPTAVARQSALRGAGSHGGICRCPRRATTKGGIRSRIAAR